MRSFTVEADSMGRQTQACSPASYRVAVLLTAGVAKSMAVPPTARLALFNASGPFWVQYDGAAAIPTTDLLGSAPELSPHSRAVRGISSLGLVAPVDTILSISFYS